MGRRENLSGQAHSGTDLQGCRCFTTPQSAARRPSTSLLAPRLHQRSVVKDRPRNSTRFYSTRYLVVFEKRLSLSLSEKLTSFVRQYQGRGSGSGGGGGPRAAASSPCVEINLACCSCSRERGDRRESFLNEEEMEDKREVIPLVIEGRREGRVLGYAQVSRPCFTAP